MRPFLSTGLAIFLFSLLLILIGANSYAQQEGTQSKFPATPPYHFAVIAQTGQTIGGRTITKFNTAGGAYVAINEKGHTVYLVNTDKGRSIFRDHTLIAWDGMSQSSGVVKAVGYPVITPDDHVIYPVVYASQPNAICFAMDNKRILQPGILVKSLKTTVLYFVAAVYEIDGNFVIPAHLKSGQAVAFANGQYSPRFTKFLKGLPLTMYGVSNSHGQMIMSDICLRFANNAKNANQKCFPFKSTLYAINDQGNILTNNQGFNLAIVPLGVAAPLDPQWTYSPPQYASMFKHEADLKYEKYYIPNFQDVGKAIQGTPIGKTIPEYEPQHFQFDTKLLSSPSDGIGSISSHASSRGFAADINNHNQIAFFVQYLAVASRYSSDYHQALILGTPGTPVPDAIQLEEATTTDAQSVSVDYTIKQTGVKSVHFAVYRSPVPTIDEGTAKPIKEQTIIDEGDLTQGDHKGVKIINGTELKPDTAKEYVVVVAKCNGDESTTYFRKWMLGVVVHGYSTWATSWSTPGSSAFADFSIPIWATKMADELKVKDGYDDVIVHSWTQSCGSSEHGVTETEGDTLSNLVSKWIIAKKEGQGTHPSDVVDIHFIGHNRGAVVVGAAINDLNVHGPFPELSEGKESSFGGGYVEVTLLDPVSFNGKHNDKFADFASVMSGIELGDLPPMSYNDLYAPALYGAFVFHFTKDIKKIYQDSSDPEVLIPSDVQTCAVWYQHNSAESCPKDKSLEHMFNFWGQVGDNALINNAVSHTAPVNVSATVAGYMQVPDLYYKNIVTSGLLNRSAN